MGGSLRNLRRNHRPGQPAGQNRNQQTDVHQPCAPGTDDFFQNAGCRGIRNGGQFGLCHITEGQQRQQNIDNQAAQKTEYRSASDGLRAGGVLRHDDCALNADKGPQCNQHCTLNLSGKAAEFCPGGNLFAPEVKVKLRKLEDKQQNQNEQNQRNDFGNRTDDVDDRRLFYAAQNQKVEPPDEYGTADNRQQIVSARKIRRKEIVEGVHGNHGITDVAADLAKPVGPADGKTDIRSEAFAAVHVNTGRQVRFDG